MVAEGTPFRGVLFAGLMIKDGRVRPVGVGRTMGRRLLQAVATSQSALLCSPDDCNWEGGRLDGTAGCSRCS